MTPTKTVMFVDMETHERLLRMHDMQGRDEAIATAKQIIAAAAAMLVGGAGPVVAAEFFSSLTDRIRQRGN